jgi:hypothetical protein
MLDKIPSHVSNKVEDKNWSEIFIFEDMLCNHTHNAKEYEKIDCVKCQCEKKEKWLENELINFDNNKTIENTLTKKLEKPIKIKVIRGKFDDCIGIQTEWQ